MGGGHMMRHDVERIRDEMSGISPGLSGCRDGVGTGVERVITPPFEMEIDNLWPSLVYAFSTVTNDNYITLLLTFWQQQAHLNSVLLLQHPHHCTQVQKWDWAHVIDVNRPMKYFDQLVPSHHPTCGVP